MADEPLRTMDCADTTDSEWSCTGLDRDIEPLLRKIAQMQEEHSMLRNQMHVMAALAHLESNISFQTSAACVPNYAFVESDHEPE